MVRSLAGLPTSLFTGFRL